MKSSDYGENFTKWDDKIKSHAVQVGVPWQWMKAICMNESSLGMDPRVARGIASPNDIEGSKSEDSLSWGIMQMTLRTARDYDRQATAVMLNSPDYSLMLASLHLKHLFKVFWGVEEWVVKAYNEGEGAALKERDHGFAGSSDEYWSRYQRHKALLL